MHQNSRDCPQPRQTRTIRPTRRSVSGHFVFRGQHAIAYESTLERDFLARTAFFVHVLDIIPQPVQVPFVANDGRSDHYTPDYLVYYRLGLRDWEDYPKPLLVEVTSRDSWRKHWRTWLPKWKAALRHAREQGWEFRIMDEARIRDAVFRNIHGLERYNRMDFPPEDTRWILEGLREMGAAPVHYLLARYFSGITRGDGIAHLWHLLASRQVDCDISQPLDESTELWLPADE